MKLRGWDYPHLEDRGPINHSDYIESSVDYPPHIEVWNMFQSGQFTHLFSCPEDWLAEDLGAQKFGTVDQYSHIKPGQLLGVNMTLYTVTEIYTFASRLAEQRVFDKGMTIRIDLNGMKGRILSTLDPMRRLFRDYVCSEKKLSYEIATRNEEILSNVADLSLKHTLWIFERFNWNPSAVINLLKEDQRRLLEGRL